MPTMNPGDERLILVRHRPELHPLHAYSFNCPSCDVQVMYLHQQGRGRRTCERCRTRFLFSEWSRDPAHGNVISNPTWVVRARALRQRPRVTRRSRRILPIGPVARPSVGSVPGIGRTFGVELEVIGLSTTRAATAIQNAGIQCRSESLSHSVPTHWKTTTDGSIGYHNAEVVSPILRGEVGLAEVVTVCSALAAAGGTVNRSCGMHVHVGVGDLSPEKVCQIVRLFQHVEPALDCLLAPSRRNGNSYCQSLRRLDLRVSTLEDLRNAYRSHNQHAKYFKVNVLTLSRQGTLEFRMHQGTVDGKKATMWVRLMLALIEDALAGTSIPATVSGMLANKPEDLRRYWTQRARTFVSRMTPRVRAEYASAAA